MWGVSSGSLSAMRPPGVYSTVSALDRRGLSLSASAQRMDGPRPRGVKPDPVRADDRDVTELSIDPGTVCVLVVDSDQARCASLLDTLQAVGYRARAAAAPSEVSAHDRPAPDVALVDLDEGGAGLVTDLRSNLIPDTPIVGLTSDVSPEGRRWATGSGAADFLLRPVEISELRMRISTVLTGSRMRRLLSDRSALLTEARRDRSAELGTTRESLSLLAAVADFHDDDSNQHAERVGLVATAIAHTLELPGDFVAMLGEAAPLHDIGKVGISRRILLKPGKLTPPEWMHMMQHVDIGGQILAPAQSPVLRLAREVARSHHEHWDGSGYTAGLIGEEIPISGRIVAVADVWDTLTHDRPYRKAWERESALAEIVAEAGAHFDPAVVEAFIGLNFEALAQPSDDGRLAA
jgi:putative two-component system response regulator